MTADGGSPRDGFVSQADVPVGTYQIVDADGGYDPLDLPDLADDALVDLYRWMVVERVFDERMVKLQRRGELGTIGSGRGQEASIVGSGYALGPDDWLLGMGREAGAMLVNGLDVSTLVKFWRGIEEAGRELARERMMIAISIGSHLPLVTGVAWGQRLDDADAVTAAYFGDGASSTGAAHEALNFAGVLGVPAVFFCQNNQYAISVPFEKQTNADSIAQRAVGYGVDGIRVDGNDVLAVYDAMSTARDRALEGNPVLVEAVTYRVDAHTTSDDPTRYRDEEEVERWRERDPIDRYETVLRREDLWGDVDPDAVREDANALFDAGLEEANAHEPRDVEEVFAYLYEDLPPTLRDQLDAFEDFLDAHPEAYDYIEQLPKGGSAE